MRFNDVSQWLAWQETLNPKEIELGLERVRRVAERLDLLNPDYKLISVAGTNGKGSCVAMLSSIYTRSRYQTGAYLSPHLLKYNERIRINDTDVDDVRLCQAFQRVDDARDGVQLTYFEFGTLAALTIFAESSLDVVILEVGLGGRLDAVNVMDTDVAVITSIDIDHVDWLGDNREQIATEKLGISRPRHPLVCGDSDPPTVIETRARELSCPLDLAGRDFHYRNNNDGTWEWTGRQVSYYGLPSPALIGEQQRHNAATCLAVVERMADRLPVTQLQIEDGLRQARLSGRFQVLAVDPVQILDVAHNPESAMVLATALSGRESHAGKTIAVFSALADKDISGVIGVMKPVIQDWYIAELAVDRSESRQQLIRHLEQGGIDAWQDFDSIADAYHAALKASGAADRVVVFGSFHTVAAVLSLVE